MQTPPQIVFHGFESSEALRMLIEQRIAAIERYHPHITTCRVAIEMPHHHHRQGNIWHVKVSVGVPGEEIVANREAGAGSRHHDPSAAVRDAFDAVRRRLQDHARRTDGRIKHHEAPPIARVIALGADHGFIATEDGRQLYFHENAVLDHAFDALKTGTPVTFVEEDGAEGPQASTLRVIR